MKRLMLILPFLLSSPLQASSPRSLREITVSARRPMSDIGIQQTRIDSVALKENAALSMADILAFNSSLFVKNHGRATLSTVSFRGTSPAHTQVAWNGMALNSPMSGMTDFSTIPSFLIDRAELRHGASSVSATGGGLGGAVMLSSAPESSPGWHLQYAQGIGSFRTFDEFAKIAYAAERWQVRTRLSLASSPNDYPYVNHDKKENIYDADHNIIGRYNPTERNRSGAFRDFHLMQEAFYNPSRHDRLGLSIWLANLRRHLPMLSTDYGSDTEFTNLQRERTLRIAASWTHSHSDWQLRANAGYENSLQHYLYEREVAPGMNVTMARTHTLSNSFYGRAEVQYLPSEKWLLSASLSARQHFVLSTDREVTLQNSASKFIGFDKGRIELAAVLSARWQQSARLGLSATLRQEFIATRFTPLIPAFLVDFLLHEPSALTFKASVTRNHRTPTLNDLYFMPGGNPELKDEHGFSYDAGLEFAIPLSDYFSLSGSATWFDSYIDNWILWLPSPRGYFSPRNVKAVHSYGIESKAGLLWQPNADWLLDLSGSLSWTPSVNVGKPLSEADRSVGRQLPYSPRISASVIGRLSWHTWSFTYKWNHYSRRFTMSSNSASLTGELPPYFMSNVTLEKDLVFRPLDLKLKLAVNNLFNEDYISVLSHPMPGINFEFFIILTPKIRHKLQRS